MLLNSASNLLIVSGVLFGVFFLNVLHGALGLPLFLSHVAELLFLLASCITFVIATLQLEKNARNQKQPKT